MGEIELIYSVSQYGHTDEFGNRRTTYVMYRVTNKREATCVIYGSVIKFDGFRAHV